MRGDKEALDESLKGVVKSSWNKIMLLFALLLALPVGAEACSAPGTLDDNDQPHALIGAADDHQEVAVLHSAPSAEGVSLVCLMPDVWTEPLAWSACVGREASWQDAGRKLAGQRLHRWLCRELC